MESITIARNGTGSVNVETREDATGKSSRIGANKVKVAQVRFSVGELHPLYNKYVEAKIVQENCGYDGRRTIARTTKPVFHAENKEGILIYKGDKLVGYKTKPAYSEIHEGYVTDVK